MRRRSAGKENNLYHNITVEVCDVRDGHALWSRNFPDEAPQLTMDTAANTLLAKWPLVDRAAKEEIKNNSVLQSRFAAMQNVRGAYLLEAFKADSGEMLGQLLVDTGLGSFRLNHAYAAGDWIVTADSDNRTRLYAMSTGEEKGTFFGSQSQLSLAAATLAIQNESGQLDIYSLPSLEKRAQLDFPSPISLQRFSADGKRLFVLTSNQTAFIFDTAALGRSGADTSGVKSVRVPGTPGVPEVPVSQTPKF